MTAMSIGLMEQGPQVRSALSPIRARLLELLREPASATELGQALGLPRQKINYHLRVLEAAGLVRLMETRARRGFTERVLQAVAQEFVVDPQLMGSASKERSQDRFAAEHLIDVAAETVRDVSRLRSGAEQSGKRLLTFTIEAGVSFADPADVHAFTSELAEAVAAVSARHFSPTGRRYRVVVGGYPQRKDHE
jgi:DNA-binding transcriptional ArsR family regulator